jgi:hypothetical protein
MRKVSTADQRERRETRPRALGRAMRAKKTIFLQETLT